MSNTFIAPGGATTFFANSDLSGTVRIRNLDVDPRINAPVYVEVPGRDLLAFIAHYIRNRRISELESADDETVLGIRP